MFHKFFCKSVSLYSCSKNLSNVIIVLLHPILVELLSLTNINCVIFLAFNLVHNDWCSKIAIIRTFPLYIPVSTVTVVLFVCKYRDLIPLSNFDDRSPIKYSRKLAYCLYENCTCIHGNSYSHCNFFIPSLKKKILKIFCKIL